MLLPNGASGIDGLQQSALDPPMVDILRCSSQERQSLVRLTHKPPLCVHQPPPSRASE